VADRVIFLYKNGDGFKTHRHFKYRSQVFKTTFHPEALHLLGGGK
jgi:hypothetical protein